MFYKVRYNPLDYDWSCLVEIDEEKAKKPIKEMIEFWWGWKNRLKIYDGNYTKLFLLQLGAQIFQMVCEDGLNLHSILEQFNNGIEGWYEMNGKYGIRIVDVDNIIVEYDDFSIEQVS